MTPLFKKKNQLGFLLGVLMLALGFYMMSRHPSLNPLALNVAPFVILAAYLVVIPLSLWLWREKR